MCFYPEWAEPQHGLLFFMCSIITGLKEGGSLASVRQNSKFQWGRVLWIDIIALDTVNRHSLLFVRKNFLEMTTLQRKHLTVLTKAKQTETHTYRCSMSCCFIRSCRTCLWENNPDVYIIETVTLHCLNKPVNFCKSSRHG